MTGAVLLIARREVITRWQQKGYRIGLLITLAIVAVAVVLPALFGSSSATSYDIALTRADPTLASVLRTAARDADVTVTLHRSTPAHARAEVAGGSWDAAVLPGPRLVVERSDDSVVAFVQSAAARASALDRLRAAGLSGRVAARALTATPLPVSATKTGENGQRITLAIITVVALFSQLITFCTWVATGVVEEKSSRVVELLLSSVRPLTLLAGKLIGIGAMALAQVVALGVVALVASTTAGTLTLGASGVVTVLISFAAFVLAFAFFAAIAAALGSTVSRQEEVSGTIAPVSVLLTICYGLGFAIAANDDSTFYTVLSYVPPFSALALPARIARGEASPISVVVAIALLLVASAAVLAAAARIYRASVLHSGSRLRLREAWRAEPVSAGG